MVLAAIHVPVHANAQKTKAPLRLTLEKAREIALEKNPELTAAKMDASINALAITEARLKNRIQFSTDLNLQRNLIIPVTPVPAIAFDPSAPEGELLPLRFTTKWTSNVGLNASIELFNPQNKLAIQEAGIREKITELENTQLANDISLDVATAYIEALITAEQLRLALADTLTNAELLNSSQQQFDEGRLLLTTLNQVKAGRNNTLNQFEEAQIIHTNAIAKLLNTIGFSPDEMIEVEFMDSLEALFISYKENATIDSLNSFSLNKQIQENALLDAQIRATSKGSLPSLTLRGYLGANYFDNNFEIWDFANWYGNSFLSLGVKLPITGSMKRHNVISQLKLQQQANMLRYESKRNKNSVEYESAIREAEVLERNYLRANENMTLADSNLRIAEQQFSSGRLSISNFNQAVYDYQKEKYNYLNAAHKFISAKLNIERLSKF